MEDKKQIEAMAKYKRLTNKNTDEYNPEYDFCMGCKYFGEPNGCNRFNGTCGNYERFIETYSRLEELEDKIENGTLKELPENSVVLSRERYEWLTCCFGKFEEIMNEIKGQARKEYEFASLCGRAKF